LFNSKELIEEDTVLHRFPANSERFAGDGRSVLSKRDATLSKRDSIDGFSYRLSLSPLPNAL